MLAQLVQSAYPTRGMKRFQTSRRHRQPDRIAASPTHNRPGLTHHPTVNRYILTDMIISGPPDQEIDLLSRRKGFARAV